MTGAMSPGVTAASPQGEHDLATANRRLGHGPQACSSGVCFGEISPVVSEVRAEPFPHGHSPGPRDSRSAPECERGWRPSRTLTRPHSVLTSAHSADRWIRRTTTASVVLLAGIAAVVSYPHLHTLALEHGEGAWASALIPLSCDGMILAWFDGAAVGFAARRPGRCPGRCWSPVRWRAWRPTSRRQSRR
ncbi:MAG TPA: DUF2637 domain-containing protein [Streptosporangiaceae bacterium]